jgi:phosphopantetheinyl transferase (holo-ACP synthase)
MRWSQHMVSVEAVEGIARRCPPAGWLSAEELRYYSQFGDKLAALAWLGGRWCAKQLLCSHLGVTKSQRSRIHIQTRNGLQQGVRPWVFLDGQLQSTKLSLAHSSRIVTAVLLREEVGEIGIDLTDPDDNHAAVREFWFSDHEVAWCEAGVSPRVVWSLKEAIYKAVNQGEPFRPRGLDVSRWLSLEDCLRIERGSGTVACSRQMATIAWRSIRGSLSIVAAVAEPNSPDTAIPKQQNSYALVS